jgi:ankyrin repeat protein
MLKQKTVNEKQTPLHYAAKYGSSEVVECLITEFKADKEERDYERRTPLFLAAEFGKRHRIAFY